MRNQLFKVYFFQISTSQIYKYSLDIDISQMNLRQISTVSSPVFLPCQVKIFNIFNWSSVLYIQFAVRVTCNMWLLKNYEISFFHTEIGHSGQLVCLHVRFWKDGITIIFIICVMIWLLQNIVTIWTSAVVLIMYLHLKHPGKQKKNLTLT